MQHPRGGQTACRPLKDPGLIEQDAAQSWILRQELRNQCTVATTYIHNQIATLKVIGIEDRALALDLIVHHDPVETFAEVRMFLSVLPDVHSEDVVERRVPRQCALPKVRPSGQVLFGDEDRPVSQCGRVLEQKSPHARQADCALLILHDTEDAERSKKPSQ